jgi:exonuclease SbcC
VRLHRLKLTNFRLHADTDISFSNGITAIVGPNGAGKTTLLEAIAWAFYGTPAVRGSRDSIRRIGAPARAQVRVEVELSLGAHDYRVVRHLYGAELYQDGESGAIANSQQAVSSKMTYLLGMNREEFFNTYFTGQKELMVMAAMGPSDRAKFLSRLLGYEKLRLAQDELRNSRSSLRGEVSGLEQGIENEEVLQRETREAEERLARSQKAFDEAAKMVRCAQTRVDDISPRWLAIQKLRESTIALQSERGIAEQRVREARREFDRLDRDLAQAAYASQRLKALKPEIDRAKDVKREFDELDRASHSAGQRRSLTGQLEEVAVQISRVDNRLKELKEHDLVDSARAALDDAHAKLNDLKAGEDEVRTAWVRAKQDADTKHLALRDQYRDVQEHRDAIVTAGPEGKCPTCARELGSEFEVVLATLASQVEEIESNGRFYSQRVKQLEKEPPEVKVAQEARGAAANMVDQAMQRLAEIEARMRELTEVEREHRRLCGRRKQLEGELSSLTDHYDPARHEELRHQVRALDESLKMAAEFEVRAERASQLAEEAEKAERLLSEQEGKFQALSKEVDESGYRQETYDDLKKAFEAAEAELRTAQLRESGLQGDLKVSKTAHENVVRRCREREHQVARLTKLRGALTLHHELDDTFEELRAELNARLRPDLSELASGFLSDVTDGRYHELELDDQYRVCIVEGGESKSVISGGEEDVANLVLRLAISQMVAERAGQPLSLLVLDEIFGGLDDSRRQNVIELLRGLADRFPQVVLITHIESVRDGVDRVLRVVVDDEERLARVREEDRFGPAEDAA